MTASNGALHVELRPGAYADSVTLLQVSRAVQGIAGVTAAQVAMATTLNVEVLTEMGFAVPPEATTNDMVVAIRLSADGDLDRALAGVDDALVSVNRRTNGASELAPPRTTAAALRDVPEGLVLLSVPGQHAFVEAMDALDAGHDVMIFSDNVPLDQELTLKRIATERGLLVMGPDCGTAVVDGLGLGFANVVAPGPVGIVAASGTGCQQLLALLDHAGVGVTSALGVGGRDLSADVGGLSTREALRRLDADPAVELIVVVSKPPADAVAAEIRKYAAGLTTPVEFALLGPGQPDLTQAAESVLRRLGGLEGLEGPDREIPTWPIRRPVPRRLSSSKPPQTSLTRPKLTPNVDDPPDSFGRVTGQFLRGLFVGGTLCDEAMLITNELLGPVLSNIPLSPDVALEGDLSVPNGAAGHTMVDFGDDALTAGRAHPMIDPALRLEHLARAALDDSTGVILLDLVLGHGAEPDPAALLAPAIAGIRQPVVIAIVGTAADPQGLERQIHALAEAGAEVHLSNAGATRRAIELIAALPEGAAR